MYQPTAYSLPPITSAASRRQANVQPAEIGGYSTGSAAVETVAFELKQCDVDSIGWSVAHYSAMSIAKASGGLVEYEDVWYDPNGMWQEPIASPKP